MKVPKRLGSFELVTEVGRGGQAVVYKAIDTVLQRVVAVKVFFKSDGAPDRQRIAGFIYEARLASALDHPNICTVHGLFEEGPFTYLVMEYVDGKNLFELAHGCPLEIHSAVRIVLQVVDALEFAHGQGIIHRDIKPRNVMVSRDGRVKVLDFGLAKQMHSPDRDIAPQKNAPRSSDPIDIRDGIAESLYVTPPGVTQGTPSTSAPEMTLGRGTDERSDVFSTGVILYLLLTGGYPFMAPSKEEVIKLVTEEEPIPVSVARNVGSPLPISLIAVVRRALRKRPEERFQTMAELQNALREVLLEIGEQPDPTLAAPILFREANAAVEGRNMRKPFMLAVLVAVVAVITSFILFSLS